MANKNFSDFDVRTGLNLLSTDYLVGYTSDGPLEIRTTLNDIFYNSSLPRIALNVSSCRGLYGFSVNGSEVVGDVGFACNLGSVSGIYSVAAGTGTTNADYSLATGFATWVTGDYSIAGGYGSLARNNFSTSLGYKSKAVHNHTFVWSDGLLGTTTNGISSTRTGQFRVDASGGSYFSGSVGINTDNPNNSLTVDGNLSASSVDVVGNLEADSLSIYSDIICNKTVTCSSANVTGTVNCSNVNVSKSIQCSELTSNLITDLGNTIRVPATLSATNYDITFLSAQSGVPVQGTKTQTGLFITIFVGTSSLYIPLFK